MTPEQQRNESARRVLAMFRPSQLLMDENGHIGRELKFSQWFVRNESLTRQIADRIADIGMRKEAWP